MRLEQNQRLQEVVMESGTYKCEKCGKDFEWAIVGNSGKNIQGRTDNGINDIASMKCPFCHTVQMKSLIFESKYN